MTERNLPKKSPVDAAIGTNIRRIRRDSNFTLNELSQIIGISFQRLQKYETGANRVSASMLMQVSEALKVRITDLLPNMGKALNTANPISQELDDLRAQIIDTLDDLNLDDLKSLLDEALAMSKATTR